MKPVTLYSSQASIEAAWTVHSPETTGLSGMRSRTAELTEPLLAGGEDGERREASTAAAVKEQPQEMTAVQIHDDSEQQ